MKRQGSQNRAQRRLLYVVADADYFISHRLDLARSAKAAGYDVWVATSPEARLEPIRCAGLNVVAVQLIRRIQNPLAEWAAYQELLHVYRKLCPDVVHHIALKAIMIGGSAARKEKIPVVVHTFAGLGSVFVARHGKLRWLRGLLVLLLRRACRGSRVSVVVQNADDRSLLLRRAIVESSQTRLIPGVGVNLQQFRPAPEPSGTICVVLPSRLIADKGIREFVKAAQRLHRLKVDCRLVLVGPLDPSNATAIAEEEVREWQAAGWIEWLGESQDMPRVYRQCHIVCLPSYREGLPRVLVEAGAAGRPVVATNVPGCRDVVLNESTGLLVPPHDADALAAGIQRLVVDGGLRRRLGEQARVRVEQSFDEADIHKRLIRLYTVAERSTQDMSSERTDPGLLG